MSSAVPPVADSRRRSTPGLLVPNPKSKLADQCREVLRFKHYSYRTELTCLGWIERFVRLCRRAGGAWRHPRECGEAELTAFLSHLANEGRVGASTQNQAFNAVHFFYKAALRVELKGVQARRARQAPCLRLHSSKERALVSCLVRCWSNPFGVIYRFVNRGDCANPAPLLRLAQQGDRAPSIARLGRTWAVFKPSNARRSVCQAEFTRAECHSIARPSIMQEIGGELPRGPMVRIAAPRAPEKEPKAPADSEKPLMDF